MIKVTTKREMCGKVMRRNRFHLLAPSITAGSGQSSPATAGGDLKGQTITVFSQDVDQDGWQGLVQAFEQQTGIKIKGIKAPDEYSADVQKLTVSLSSGDSTYDVVRIDELMAKNFEKAGFLEPIDSVFTPEVLKDFNEDELKAFSQMNGKYYTVPVTTDSMVLFANVDLFKQAGVEIPKSESEFMAAAAKLTKPDGSQYGYGASWSKGGQLFNDAIRWALAYGGDYNNWKDPNTQKAFKAMHDFIYKDKITPKSVLGDSYDALTKSFVDGKYAMMYQWQGFSGKMGDKFGKNFVVIPNMTFSTNKTIGASWFYSVNKESKHKAAATAFMKWVASKDGQSSLIKMPAHNSGSKQVLKASEFQINKNMSEYLEANSIAPRPLTENVNQIMDQTETVLSKYLSDQISFEQCISDGQKILDSLIKK